MTSDKEIVKTKIRELASKIKDEEEEWLCETYELEIADLIINYSIRHDIKIPLINYELYGKVRPEPPNEEKRTILKRKKLDHTDSDEKVEDEYFYRENHIYFEDFVEAIGEEGLTRPRFWIHPEIRELVACWNVE